MSLNINSNTPNQSLYLGANDEIKNRQNIEEEGVIAVGGGKRDESKLADIIEGDRDPMNSTGAKVIRDTDTALSMMGKKEEDGESSETIKEHMKEVYKNLDSKDLAKLRAMHIDVTSADLNQIMGVLNSIEGVAEMNETKALMADVCDGFKDSDISELSKRVKSTVADHIPDANLGVEFDKILSEDFKISEAQADYLLKNELDLTVDNLYRSEYSIAPGRVGEPLSDEAKDMLVPELKKTFEEAQVEATDAHIDRALSMVEKDIPVTADNLRNLSAIEDINKNGINGEALVGNVAWLSVMKMDVNEANVYFSYSEKVRSLNGRIEAYREMNFSMEAKTESDISKKRKLLEVQLSMTESVSYRMVKNDIHIDTKGLSEIVDAMRQAEKDLATEAMGAFRVPASKENVSLFAETMEKTEALKNMPAASLVLSLRSETMTINSLYSEGMTALAKGEISAFAKEALKGYEPLMTGVRTDMGDSIRTAFSRADSLVRELGMEPTDANMRAVRILGYNQMEISEESIARIKQADLTVNEMLTEMTPKAVLDLIRNGENPLEINITELLKTLRKNRGDDEIADDERFSSFLQRLDKKGDITDEERTSFIGIFRLLNKVQKNSGRDIGTVVRNGQELSLKNLLSAHRSNQAKGMDFSASDEIGMISDLSLKGTSISDQINAAYNSSLLDNIVDNLTPEGLVAAFKEDAISESDMTLEYFNEIMEREVTDELDEAFTDDIYSELELPENLDECQTFLDENNISMTYINLKAAEGIISANGGFFADMVKTIKKTDAKEDEERLIFDTIRESFDEPEKLEESFGIVSERMTELYEDSLENGEGNIGFADLIGLKTTHAGMRIFGNLARDEKYQVPIYSDGAVSVMNVTFTKGESEGISFTFFKESYGNIRAELLTGEKASGNIETELMGRIEISDALMERARRADTKADRYRLAKDMIEELVAM